MQPLRSFFLNGKESPDLTLLKGYTYVFACNTGTNSFYLSTQLNSTGFASEYTHSNLSGSRATSGDLIFTVPNDFDTNATLYYCSSQNAFMGNAIRVIDSIPDSTIVPFPNQTSITPSVSHDLSLKATFSLNQYLVTISSGTGKPDSGNKRDLPPWRLDQSLGYCRRPLCLQPLGRRNLCFSHFGFHDCNDYLRQRHKGNFRTPDL